MIGLVNGNNARTKMSDKSELKTWLSVLIDKLSEAIRAVENGQKVEEQEFLELLHDLFQACEDLGDEKRGKIAAEMLSLSESFLNGMMGFDPALLSKLGEQLERLEQAQDCKPERKIKEKEADIVSKQAQKTDAREGKYLTFVLDGEEYGVGVKKIKEIIGMLPITPVPQTPGFVLGVINLRGKVIPVVDLRLRFEMEARRYSDCTCIVVMEIETETVGIIQTGIVVDSVSEVLNIKAEEIENTPSFGVQLNTDYILGMAKMEGGVKILLDIDQVLSAREMSLLEEVD